MPNLLQPLDVVANEINARIDEGSDLRSALDAATDEDSVDEWVHRETSWFRYNVTLLGKLFPAEFVKQYTGTARTLIFMPYESLEGRKKQLRGRLDDGIAALQSLVQQAPLLDVPGQPVPAAREEQSNNRRVFIVHGHHRDSLAQVARVISEIGLEPVILGERARGAATIIEKLEAEGDVGFVVVLMSPDDVGRLGTEPDLAPRARQNVIFEVGYFIARARRDRVLVFLIDELAWPTDIQGVAYEPFDNGWRLSLARHLKAAGVPFELEKLVV